MSSQEGTPLLTVSGWSSSQVKKLAERWITTVEQVVGMAASPDGMQTLARELGVPLEEMRHLVRAARAALPPSVAAELEKEVDTREYGLGALPPGAHPKPPAGAEDS